ncbi:MAG: hypothetical protein Q9O62_01835 [Ardenticatenia bacterium]|nr:hypothetical protein [Ardenticatenia bacterium]
MKKYHIWTIGCQMNVADSQRLGSALEKRGFTWTDRAEEADVIVLNTCVVRQQAEEKIYGRLGALKPLKARPNPPVIGLMGCLVGVRNPAPLRKAFPFVDVFLPPLRARPTAGLFGRPDVGLRRLRTGNQGQKTTGRHSGWGAYSAGPRARSAGDSPRAGDLRL